MTNLLLNVTASKHSDAECGSYTHHACKLYNSCSNSANYSWNRFQWQKASPPYLHSCRSVSNFVVKSEKWVWEHWTKPQQFIRCRICTGHSWVKFQVSWAWSALVHNAHGHIIMFQCRSWVTDHSSMNWNCTACRHTLCSSVIPESLQPELYLYCAWTQCKYSSSVFSKL